MAFCKEFNAKTQKLKVIPSSRPSFLNVSLGTEPPASSHRGLDRAVLPLVPLPRRMTSPSRSSSQRTRTSPSTLCARNLARSLPPPSLRPRPRISSLPLIAHASPTPLQPGDQNPAYVLLLEEGGGRAPRQPRAGAPGPRERLAQARLRDRQGAAQAPVLFPSLPRARRAPAEEARALQLLSRAAGAAAAAAGLLA